MAWKREDPPSPEPTAPLRPASSTPNPTTTAPGAETRRGERATIGPSIFIKGDLAGEEDLVIEGRVEGKIDLKQHHITVGKNGRVKAEVFGRVVIVEGEVDGNVFAQEQAILRQSGAVRGNISSPRVVLEDGSRFKGAIDMEPKDFAKLTGTPAPAAAAAGNAGKPTTGAAADTATPNRPPTPSTAG